MYLWSLLLSAGALAVWRFDGRIRVGLILLGAATLFLVTVLPRLNRRRTHNGHRNGFERDRADDVGGATPPAPDPQDADAPERNESEHP
jgi:hypothetical protein